MLSSRVVPLNIDGQYYPSKTPGRLKGRVENAIYPATVNGKAKEVSKTPFRPATLQKNLTQGKPTIITTRPAVRPLGDKTPFPNRIGNQQFQTPLPQSSKFPALSLLEPDTLLRFERTPESLLRPSSLRKHVRAPRSASRSFETPQNQGNHWDVSEASIVIPESEVQEIAALDDHDEIEYMPPNTLDLPYQPPFDFELPNYKEVGKTLLKLAHSYPFDDSPAAEITMDEEAAKVTTWNLLALPEIDNDDPFHEAITAQKQSIASSVTHNKLSLNDRAVIKAAKTQGATGTPKIVPTPKSVAIKRASLVPSSAADLKTTKSRTPASVSAATTTILPASRATSGTKALKSAANLNKPGAPAVRQISSLKSGVGAAGRKQGPMAPTVAATTGAISSRPAATNTAAARNRATGTWTAATTQPAAVRRPTTTKSNIPLRSFLLSTTKADRPAPGRAAGRVGADREVDILVIRSSLTPEDDFRFNV